MERYRCHKAVEAGKIEAIYLPGDKLSDGVSTVTGGGYLVKLEGDPVLRSLASKHTPEVGGYFVRYEDGYTSYSPARAFEGGYHREADGDVGKQQARHLERMARVCHEINRAYSLGCGEDPASVFPSWLEAPEAIRESARIGVRKALEGATPEQLHESWCDTKVAGGWIYGPVKDFATKQHHCLVPYAELPAAQRLKDALFSAVVQALR